MPGPGYSSRCKACNSPHRAEIDAKFLGGESARSVAEWLATAHSERITFQALANHHTEHLDVRAEALAQVEASTPVFQAAVAKVVADASVLDEVAGAALRVVRGLVETMASSSAKPSMATVVLFNGALSNARAAVTDRHELLHGKKLEVTSVGGPPETDPEALCARVADLLARATGEADPSAARAADPDRAG